MAGSFATRLHSYLFAETPKVRPLLLLPLSHSLAQPAFLGESCKGRYALHKGFATADHGLLLPAVVCYSPSEVRCWKGPKTVEFLLLDLGSWNLPPGLLLLLPLCPPSACCCHHLVPAAAIA